MLKQKQQKLYSESGLNRRSDIGSSTGALSRTNQRAASSHNQSTTIAREYTVSGVELDEAYYPKNRHTDQVCKTFYRIVKEKKQPTPSRPRKTKGASNK